MTSLGGRVLVRNFESPKSRERLGREEDEARAMHLLAGPFYW